MTIKLNIDGTPFVVLFSGSIEIERMADGETVAIRGASDGFKLWGMAVDAKTVELEREESGSRRTFGFNTNFKFW